jgi:hypothetical protein
VLNRDWDPIGSCPPDEYDSYVDALAVMIRQNATDEDLMRYLERAEREHMGLGFDAGRARNVIVSLRALKPR